LKSPARSAEELAYDEAWDAMRAGDFKKAATGFARVNALSPAGALADDAAFYAAVAFARGGRSAAAITAFREMIDTYPSSPRIGEANAMLGWLLVDARQPQEAARRFLAAADDPAETVRASARKGLSALGIH
jgi:TolA-binding protein